MAYTANNFKTNIIIVLSNHCINQILWSMILWIFLFIWMKMTGFHGSPWLYNNPSSIILWNFFNDFVPYVMTSYGKKYSIKVGGVGYFLVVCWLLYTAIIMSFPWQLSSISHRWNYFILWSMVLMAKVFMVWTLFLKLQIQQQ